MARTREAIQSEMLQRIANTPELTVYNSSSKTALFRLITYVVSWGIFTLESLFDVHKEEVETTIATRRPGTPAWYAEITKEFQLGDDLILVDNVPQYETIDEAKRIVTRVAYKENAGTLTLKVAKGEVGATEPLSDQELTQLETYLDKRKYAGTPISLVSLNADRLRLMAEIFYDGIYDLATIQESVKNALNSYMENLRFDGLVLRSEIIEAVKAVPGVIDIDINDLTVMEGANPNEVDRAHETASGYIIEETDENFTFDDLLTYTAA